MKMRTVTLWTAAVLALAAVLVWAFRPTPVSVETATVARGRFVRTVNDDGVTRVRDRYTVAAPVSGTLLRPGVRAGDVVKRQQTLAIIVPNPAQMLDPRTRGELAARVEAADARRARAGAAVSQAEAASTQAGSNARRLQDLAAKGYAAAAEREQAELQLTVRQRELEAARYELDAAEHDVQQARAALQRGGVAGRSEHWRVAAPVSAQVLRVYQESESPIAIGAPIMELGDVSRLEARLDILSSEAAGIPVGARVALEAAEHLQLTGRVRRVEPAARTKISALGIEEQRVDVLVDLDPLPAAAGRLGDAFRVDARIEIEHLDDALLVPVTALFRDGSQWAVFKLVSGRAVLTPVQLQAQAALHAAVRAGLIAGDVVIVYPSDAVRDQVRVRATE